ncbi:hypothetical protein PVAP13_2NG499203 [Panicum virgatum]|uniref:Uncharacterized protein n=1 Tax=Panicum virgatum TaxID=38727 RepID=A0A8T0VQA8_PANVG|nr:hypothetical protein PVAP13_2NG499203 [Panicum virgatum]
MPRAHQFHPTISFWISSVEPKEHRIGSSPGSGSSQRLGSRSPNTAFTRRRSSTRPAEATASGRTPTPRRQRGTRRAGVDRAVAESPVLVGGGVRPGSDPASPARDDEGGRVGIEGSRLLQGRRRREGESPVLVLGRRGCRGTSARGARPLADAPPATGGRCRLPAWSPPLRRYRGKTEPSWRSSRAGLQLRSIAGGEPRVIGASAWIFGCVRSAGGVDPYFSSLLRSLSLSQSLPIWAKLAMGHHSKIVFVISH